MFDPSRIILSLGVMIFLGVSLSLFGHKKLIADWFRSIQGLSVLPCRVNALVSLAAPVVYELRLLVADVGCCSVCGTVDRTAKAAGASCMLTYLSRRLDDKCTSVLLAIATCRDTVQYD